jgi:hypothetical protein
MKCNWKVDNSGLLLEQPDLAYSLIWTWIWSSTSTSTVHIMTLHPAC